MEVTKIFLIIVMIWIVYRLFVLIKRIVKGKMSESYWKMRVRELEAENYKLKLTMQLHAGDCYSLNNEVELFRGHWEDAEERCKELSKIVSDIEDWATVSFDESLLKLIKALKAGEDRE